VEPQEKTVFWYPYPEGVEGFEKLGLGAHSRGHLFDSDMNCSHCRIPYRQHQESREDCKKRGNSPYRKPAHWDQHYDTLRLFRKDGLSWYSISEIFGSSETQIRRAYKKIEKQRGDAPI
jgi:hypothetical protein